MGRNVKFYSGNQILGERIARFLKPIFSLCSKNQDYHNYIVLHIKLHGGRLESNILTEADIANSATQFLVDIQLMAFAPSLGDFLPPPDPNSYVLQTDNVIKKVTKQATAKKTEKEAKNFQWLK